MNRTRSILEADDNGATPREEDHDEFVLRSFPSVFDITPLFPFYVESECRLAGSISIVYVDVAGQHWVRTERHIRQDEVDALAVSLSIDIAADDTMGDRRICQTPGMAGLYDMSQPPDHRSTSGKSIQLVIPRKLALRHGIDPAEVCGIALPETHCRVLLAHLFQVREFGYPSTPQDGTLVEASILTLLAFAIRASAFDAGARSDHQGNANQRAVEAYVLWKLESPSLRVSRVARDLELSRSTLYRYFID